MKIEKGIPIPIPNDKNIYKQVVQDRLDIFKKMEITDSIFFETLREADIFRATIFRFYGNGNLVSRKFNNGYRLWKVKKGESKWKR